MNNDSTVYDALQKCREDDQKKILALELTAVRLREEVNLWIKRAEGKDWRDSKICELQIALGKIRDRECECYFVGDSSCCHFMDQEVAREAIGAKEEKKC